MFIKPKHALRNQAMVGATFKDPKTGIPHIRVPYSNGSRGDAAYLKRALSTTPEKQARRAQR